ncbi:MAG: tetratricopeptide repeat protein, partial [Anaerolineae bacterium]
CLLLAWAPVALGAPAAPPPAKPPAKAPADPLAPLVTSQAGRKAVGAFVSGRMAKAAELVGPALEVKGQPAAERSALRMVRALARTRVGLAADPADLMALMNDPAGLGLGSHAAWLMGRQLWDRGLAAGEVKAFDLARPYLERVAFPGRFGLEARGRLVRGLMASGKIDEACSLAERTADGVYRRFGEAQAMLSLASCRERSGWALAKAGRRKEAKQALIRAAGLYKTVAVLWPERWAGPIARKHLERMAKAGHKPQVDAPSLLARARDILARPMGVRDQRALWRVRTLLPWNLKDPLGAEAELLWAELSMRHRRFRRSWRSASRVQRLAAEPELKARAALLLGALTARRRSAQAVGVYLDLVERWPTSAQAAQALYRAAELTRRRGRAGRAAELFGRCVKEYDGQPAADLCRWGLAWAAIREGELGAALGWLEPLTHRGELFNDEPALVELIEDEQALAQGESVPGDREEEEGGGGDQAEGEPVPSEPQAGFDDPSVEAYRLQERARYWKARLLQLQGKAALAVPIFRQVVEDHPFSYYALMAWARLGALGKAPKLSADRAVFGPAPVDALYPEVAAALAYQRMGLGNEARVTLMSLRRTDLEHPIDRRWAAVLRQAMGDYSRSHRLAPVPRSGGLP